MDTTGSRAFPVTVNVPRSYFGRAELRVGRDDVTLVARPVRHFHATLFSYIGVVVVAGVVVLLAVPGSLEVRSAVYGAIAGGLGALLFWRLRSSGGEPRSMSLPPTAVSLAKQRGRVLVVIGAFDSRVRSGRWTLVADSPDDAKAMASALTTDGT